MTELPYRPGPPRRRRILVLVAVTLAGVAVAGGTGVALTAGHRTTPPPAELPAATTPVLRQTLVESVTADGTVGYGARRPLEVKLTGTVTWLPAAGSVLRRGSTVARVDESPVLLFYGPIPMYRPLAVGTTGADVRQFEENLRALGYGGFTVDDRYTGYTRAAVRRWQRAVGLRRTGTVDAGHVVYAAGPVRVAALSVRPGAAAPAEVSSVTGTTMLASVPLSAGSTGWARPGARVTVRLPGGRTVPGRVAAVDPAGDPALDPAAAANGTGAPAGSGVATVALGRTGLRVPDRSPVRVSRVVRRHADVLTVPVVALLALPAGGYGLEVVDAGSSRLVPVRVGMFSAGRVEVRSPQLHPGQQVGMPG